ncbi:putative Glycosyltransferase [Vibrio crassostreae]|uniref:glycosyltransferase family 2 protein n=1 Tax=Vibrio crassostreae TaxID=246167 RepID=UPI001047A0E9|nr:glycosyltransferase family 2 protein [Vibrio crassostreae]TCN85193.1 glycosyl transferase family 2 [Vibrio crassostreae]CAK3029299.1 putative Glycosyltransferase [Vibrio crassostreae]
MFDVVIPLYNKKGKVIELYEHVLEISNISNYIYIVDDKSTDGSYELLKEKLERLNSSTIHLVQLEKNSGPQIARSYGAELSSSEWILFMDSDDFICLEGVEYISKKLNEINSKYALINGKKINVSHDFSLNDVERLKYSLGNETRSVNNALKFMKEPIPAMSGFFLRKKYAREMENVNASWGEDVIFFLNLIKEHEFLYFDVPISIYKLGVPGSRGAMGGTLKKRLCFIKELLTFRESLVMSDVLFRLYYTLRVLSAWLYKKIK